MPSTRQQVLRLVGDDHSMEAGNASTTSFAPGSMSVATALDDALLQPAQATATTLNGFLTQIERRAFRMAEMHLGQREEAMDAVQDAMLRLVKHYRDRPAEEWTPLFWGILRRRIIDLQRRRKVRSIVVGWLGGNHDDHGDDLPVWEPADPSPGPLERLHDAKSYADLAAAVRKLPQRQRETFIFRMLEGLDVAETAKAMGCSEGSVKTHLSRAMQHMRIHMENWR